MDMKYSLVIPVFNEAESLGTLQKDMCAVMNATAGSYEIVYVDDASTDTSLAVMQELKKQFPHVRILSFKENKGQSAALYAGFKAAIGEWIITLDADGQNPPQEIVRLLPFCGSYDFITGIREKRQDSFMRKKASWIARTFRRLILGDITQDVGCSLRIFKREIVGEVPFFKNFHRFFTFLVRAQGFRIKEVLVGHQERRFGKSKYTTLKRLGEGIWDLSGVLWLKKRLIRYEYKYKN